MDKDELNVSLDEEFEDVLDEESQEDKQLDDAHNDDADNDEEDTPVDSEDESEQTETSEDETGEDVEEEKQSNPVRDLRKAYKNEKLARLALENEIKRLKQTAPELELELPPEPDISDPDVDYDPDKLKQKTLQWAKLKVQHEQQQERKIENEKKKQELFDAKFAEYQAKKTSLGYRDYADSENAVINALDINKQGIIINYVDEPANLVYVLGKSPVTLQRLSEIDDPLLFQRELLKIEQKANATMSQNQTTKPERVLGGGSKPTTSSNKALEKAYENAQKTGDYNAYFELKRKQK